jgi:hypothetical protein
MFSTDLPETKAVKQQKRTVKWLPLPGLKNGSGDAVCGVMEITTVLSKNRSEVCSYVVTERPTQWPGRYFHLAKGNAGSDPDNTAYDVFCGSNGLDRICQCKGFERWNFCKHYAGLVELIQAGQIPTQPPEPLANPDADTTNTEYDYYPADWQY